ncbi:competence protein ComEA [Bacillus sp. 491mf]|uniref:helix-hairpin-helix domain-containing protein n=1 Tax=Bacillus sp. 491mf TaxID=1761755 RepID=UPI0008EE976E|nr:helix-hairpin-helix domain-containing protein [Bacillus sp. 491mf]SFC52456.1 competence protein ComEA [Bacillus sp. 491mf]
MMMNLPRKWFVLFAAIGIVIILFLWQTKDGQKQAVMKVEANANAKMEEKKEKTKGTESKLQSKTILVDTKGAVNHEGVYELQSGARVKDAVEKAGGFLPEADITKVNLAQLVQDQMLIYVPKKGEALANGAPLSDGKIQINIATKEQLEKISGIGPRKAENIIKYREQHGPFQKVEDLLEVDGIGEKSLEKIKDEIIVH